MRMTRYSPPKGAYKSECEYSSCKEKRVICQECGNYGHPDFYKHDEKHLIPIVEHAHFLINKDTGRNVFHKVGEPFICPEEIKVHTWRTIRGYDRWRRMPKEVRENLGWETDENE